MKLSKSAQIDTIRRMAATIQQTAYDESWIGTDNPSYAFLICVAMGPWKEKRRFKVANDVIRTAIGISSELPFDLARATPSMFPYPLTWQTKIVNSMIESLRDIPDLTFSACCDRWWEIVIQGDTCMWESIALEFFDMCGVSKKGTKTLWLFLRDVLGIPAFPIDRRVRRVLQANSLPTDSWVITRLCEEAGVRTNDLARACFIHGEVVEPTR